jgi:hypothetical protein
MAADVDATALLRPYSQRVAHVGQHLAQIGQPLLGQVGPDQFGCNQL